MSPGGFEECWAKCTRLARNVTSAWYGGARLRWRRSGNDYATDRRWLWLIVTATLKLEPEQRWDTMLWKQAETHVSAPNAIMQSVVAGPYKVRGHDHHG